MPFPNEHACRLHPPDQFRAPWVRITRTSKTVVDTPTNEFVGFSVVDLSRRATHEMRMESDASCGGCHIPNYRTEVLILVPNVDCTYGIPMSMKPTATPEAPSIGSLSFPTGRARGGGPTFFLKNDGSAHTFPFVGELPAHCPESPLVELLVDLLAVVQARSDVPYISNHERLHPCLLEGGDHGPRGLVLDVSDLILKPSKLTILRSLQSTPPPGTLLQGVQAACDLSLDLVLVSPFGSEETPVVDHSLPPIEGRSGMDFSKIDPGCFCSDDRVVNLLVVDGSKFVLLSVPPDLNLPGHVPFPGDTERGIALAIRQNQPSAFDPDSRRLPDHFEKPPAPSWGPGPRVGLSALSPGLQGGAEGLDGRLCRLRVECLRPKKFHQGIGRQPYPFLPNNPPEIDESTGIEIPGGQGQPIESVGLADL